MVCAWKEDFCRGYVRTVLASFLSTNYSKSLLLTKKQKIIINKSLFSRLSTYLLMLVFTLYRSSSFAYLMVAKGEKKIFKYYNVYI